MPFAKTSTPRLIDATLREGLQAPNANFALSDIIETAHFLAQAGSDMLEVGHPLISNKAMHHVRAVADLGLNLPLLSHARAKPADIYAVAHSGADWVGIFIGVNEISQSARLNQRSFEEILRLTNKSVSLARELGLKVRFTVEDASRTNEEKLHTSFATALAAGANRLCYADSVGVCEPQQVVTTFRKLVQLFPQTDLEGHFHNDRGLAIANALAAIDGGASWISVSVNGLGERCGITDHGVLAANLSHRGTRPISNTQGITFTTLAQRISQLSSQPLPKCYPVFGDYAFTHTARLHVLAVKRNHSSYEWMSPDTFGRCHKTMP
ncbi:homocitrate synthase [Halomonas eurihalina]|uniref:2-isopropylmalate synthase n=1 Tax=Halomonas eurihalina TaxID=42566 RepID=A0A5D9DDP3_HALER|nr:LeuA family protein [Halomonas eurihalina]MDR5859275.1 LeuA family protein [Halomonas eurihalina]TZG40901.1 homocitrate synthase [Halomonas eurihalina]